MVNFINDVKKIRKTVKINETNLGWLQKKMLRNIYAIFTLTNEELLLNKNINFTDFINLYLQSIYLSIYLYLLNK